VLAPSPSSWVLHLDIDAFFASVEQRDNPRLRNQPVAVGTGVVASCSYEAKRQGVQTGMSLAEARRRCPRLRILPGDYRRYEQAARRVQAICLERTPEIEVGTLDDLYLDLGRRPGPGAVERLMQELARQILAEVGLGVSIGAGSNKLIARVATLLAKKRRVDNTSAEAGGIVVVPHGEERAFLAPWPVQVLPGIGRQAEARFQRINVQHVGEVAEMPLQVLLGLFGRRGRLLRDWARGIDPRPVVVNRVPQSVSRCTSFDPPVGDPEFVLAMLHHLVERASSWLRLQHMTARGLTVQVRYSDGRCARARVSFPSFHDEEGAFRTALASCLQRVSTRRLPFRLVGVELAPLRAASGQGELFPDPKAERLRRLTACKDAIRKRFGFLSLRPGSTLVLSQKLEQDRDNLHLRTPCLTR
jgi:DNA polymerase-4